MPYDTPLTDDYVADILSKEASRNPGSQRFLAGGFGSLLSRPRSHAPKPNTRFLRNIIRDTDSHNAALKAREEADSRARLRSIQSRHHKDSHRSSNRRHRDDQGRESDRAHRDPHHRRGDRDRVREGREERGEKSRRSRSPRARRSSSPEERTSHRKRRRVSRRHDEDQIDRSTQTDRSQHRSHSLRLKGLESKDRRASKKPHVNSPSPSRVHDQKIRQSNHAPDEHSDSASDTSDLSIGPDPAPAVRPRGRGAHTASALSSFSSPSASTRALSHFGTDRGLGEDRFHPISDPEAPLSSSAAAASTGAFTVQDEITPEDEWHMALNALRDRAKWRNTHAGRSQEVSRASGGGERKFGGYTGSEPEKEKDVSDVRWAKAGEGREWDRGKVFNGNSVDIVPEWSARLSKG